MNSDVIGWCSPFDILEQGFLSSGPWFSGSWCVQTDLWMCLYHILTVSLVLKRVLRTTGWVERKDWIGEDRDVLFHLTVKEFSSLLLSQLIYILALSQLMVATSFPCHPLLFLSLYNQHLTSHSRKLNATSNTG